MKFFVNVGVVADYLVPILFCSVRRVIVVATLFLFTFNLLDPLYSFSYYFCGCC